jgi:hypothetical protein
LTNLTPKAEELVKAGREALRPSEADRKRVFHALLPQLGGGLGAGGVNAPSTAPAAPAAASGVAVKVATAIAVIGVAGGGLFLALQKEPPSARPLAPAPVASASALKPRIEQAPETPPAALPRAESAEKRAPVPSSRPADSLAEEVAILSEASAALHGGRPAAALKLLDEHRKKFPRGALGQERTSARIQALCALGRTKEAQADLARLARAAPNSPHVARARKACGSGPAEK